MFKRAITPSLLAPFALVCSLVCSLALSLIGAGCASMGTTAHMKTPGGQGPVSDTLSSHQKDLERCISQSISLNSGESLKLIVTFVHTAKGMARDVDIERMSSPDPDFQDCIIKKIRRFRFPPTASGEDENVRYPLIFVQSAG